VDNVRFSLASNAPIGASIDSRSGSFTWTPSNTQSGTYTFDVIATTDWLEGWESITITVNDVSEAKPEPEYLDNGCPVGYPYIWLDGWCYDSPETLVILAPFVYPNQDPQYYIDRYNSEPSYKEWFDENYPEYVSIYEAGDLDNSNYELWGIENSKWVLVGTYNSDTDSISRLN